MPPLGVEREEAVAEHGIAQDKTVRLLLGSDSLVVGVREFAELVEHAAHIHFLAGLDMYEREVNSRAAAMP